MAIPAPVNPHKGTREGERVFEVAQKPRVETRGGTWVITFAARAGLPSCGHCLKRPRSVPHGSPARRIHRGLPYLFSGRGP